jgi:hypothetical protein
MSDTPRTDACLTFDSIELCETLERELATARAEIDRLQVNSIHTCNHECPRLLCVMRRELDAANRKIDLYKIPLEVIANWPDKHDETTPIRMAAAASHVLNYLHRPASADTGENPPPESHHPDGVVVPAGHHS